jgi:hypothetical protein
MDTYLHLIGEFQKPAAEAVFVRPVVAPVPLEEQT